MTTMNSVDSRVQVQTGTGMIQNNSSKSPQNDSKVPKVSSKKVDTMVDSYLTSVTSSNVICVDSLKMNATRKSSVTGPSKSQDSTSGKTEEGNSFDYSMSPEATDPSETPSVIPGLSIITWEEFIEEPSLLHNLFSMDKDEFIHFDCNIVNNFFHDSRMEPPLLGGPSGDGLSWTIFVDSYSQLKEVREFITTRISVLLVDLVKPNNSGTASCLIVINPMDDHIRRVLHLTLSRAMETVFAERSFSVEIDLNESVRQWCQGVLQMDCKVQGGRIVVTNGDPVESFCLIENPLFCALAFPAWLYRRIRYLIHRKRYYDDTLVKFEGANFVLCTRSETLRKYSEAMQLSAGDRLIHRNDNAVTTATQTIDASTQSLDSELSVQEIEEASDNDAMKRRGVNTATETLETSQCFSNPSFQPDKEKHSVMECESGADETSPHAPHGHVNKAERDFTDTAPTNMCAQQENESHNIQRHEQIRSVHFNSKGETAVLDIDLVAQANLAKENSQGSNNSACQKKAKIVKYANTETGTAGDHVPSPRSAILLRPDTPFQPKPKPRKSKMDLESIVNVPNSSPSTNTPSVHADINDKIVKRQKKISNLLKDLISFNTPSYNVSSENDDDVRGSENENETDANNGPRISKNNFFSTPSNPPVKSRKVIQHPAKSLNNSQTSSVFPYTSDLINFPALSDNEDVAKLERYGARLKKNESSNKKKSQNRREDMLFLPRLDLEEVDPDRNCFSDQDIAADSDLTDLEQEQEGVVSDTEGILSARLIPVYSTERTLSIDSVNNNGFKSRVDSINKSDLDSDLEITDCEIEEPRQMNSPRILPGALAAQQLRASSGHARSRDYIPPNVHANRRGGTQNDSRRRYLALNSLRRRAYKLALQSQIRNQSRPSSAELVSYNNIRPASGTHVTIMSKV